MKILQINTFSNNGQIKVTNHQSVNFTSRFTDSSLKQPIHVKPIYAYRDFAQYRPLIRDFGSYKIPIHNEGIGIYLQPEYDANSFKTLFDFAKKKNTFEYVINNKTGFVKTSLITHKENALMSDLIWITDTCNNMELIKYFNPEKSTKVFNKLTDFYEAQQDKFDEIINNPEKYKLNGVFSRDTKYGVGHCFIPETKTPHKWYPRTRLESIGNYLQVATDLIENGFKGANYGYKNADEIPQKVINAIANSVKYLKAIDYPNAKSCGAWEEQTFVNSLTSDTAIINQGFRKILNLMYSPTDNQNIILFRKRILNTKNGDVFKNEQGLRNTLKSGEKRILIQPDIEISQGNFSKKLLPYEEKALNRDYDSAISFMIQTEKLHPSDIRKDSFRKLVLLKKLEKNLVRDNGAIRYKGDEYLNLDYHELFNKKTKDNYKHEAEWFLVSEFSSAYGAIVKNLINHIKTSNDVKDIDKTLLKLALKGETEYINRAYARVSAKNMTKSNGYRNMGYKVPEAYEAITLKNGQVKYVPGAHPLTWAASSLHKASRIFADNLQELENLTILQ